MTVSPAPDPARGLAMLATALGPALSAMLEAPDTIEVIVSGPEAETKLTKLVGLVMDGFGED